MKKKDQNAKRSKISDSTTKSQKPERPEGNSELNDKDPESAEGLPFDEEIVEHIRLQTSLIEGREVSLEETREMLQRVLRQHSLAPEKRRDYVVRYLKEKEENPP